MAALVNVSLFFGSAAVIWVFSGYLIESVDRVARRFHKAGFTVAFFILGFLTSISEISVAFNSTVNGVPGVSAGNLIGASFVILLFIVPFLAIAGGGISLEGSLTRYNLLVALVAILLPAFFIIDGNVTPEEGIVALLLYTALLYSVRSQRGPMKEAIAVEQELIDVQDANLFDAVKILFGGLIIFGAGYVLVQQAVFIADIAGVPASLVGLVILSIGTNVPELVIAVRSVLAHHNEIAFGNYLGSAATNTAIFGVLAIANGTFSVEPSEFAATAALMAVGLGAFYVFGRDKGDISRKEGIALLSFYVAFLAIQVFNFVRFFGD